MAGLNKSTDFARKGIFQFIPFDGLNQRIEMALLRGSDGLPIGPALDALDGEIRRALHPRCHSANRQRHRPNP